MYLHSYKSGKNNLNSTIKRLFTMWFSPKNLKCRTQIIPENKAQSNKTKSNFSQAVAVSAITTEEALLGFTLAEVLVALAIVGILAALTIPALVTQIQDAQFHSAWKKTYADLSQASRNMAFDNGEDLKGVFRGISYQDSDVFRNEFLQYMNYTKRCNVDTSSGFDECWHDKDSWYRLSGSKYNIAGWTYKSRAILSNGALLTFDNHNLGACNGSYAPNDDNCGYIYIDVNGFKGPNTIGKDIYALMLLRNAALIPFGTEGDYYFINSSSYACKIDTLSPDSYGWSCSAKYILK